MQCVVGRDVLNTSQCCLTTYRVHSSVYIGNWGLLCNKLASHQARIDSLRVHSFGVIWITIGDPRSVWIMVHQRNWLVDSSVPLIHQDPDRYQITDPDSDHLKGTHPKFMLQKQHFRDTSMMQTSLFTHAVREKIFI